MFLSILQDVFPPGCLLSELSPFFDNALDNINQSEATEAQEDSKMSSNGGNELVRRVGIVVYLEVQTLGKL